VLILWWYVADGIGEIGKTMLGHAGPDTTKPMILRDVAELGHI
jgi:hypothetical protein